MMGSEEEPGLYLLAAHDLFGMLEQPQHAGLSLHVSAYEIYGGKVFDLLSGRACCPVREDAKKKVHIVGLKEALTSSMAGFRSLLAHAADARKTAATLANADSSRSHAILVLSLKRGKAATPRDAVAKPTARSRQADAAAAAVAAASGGGGGAPTSLEEGGRFSFIDLAGTERGADTLNCENKARRQEGAEINKSLLALKECIRGLDQGKT
jgi:kinesin family protein 2/24